MLNAPRNYLIPDVTLNWARLGQAQKSPFGVDQWELQIEVSADQAKELSANYMNVKEKDGIFTVSLRRKAVKADGSSMDPVRVVDTSKMPMENRNKIGNGSKGNVIVWQAPYDSMGRSGVSSSLTAVQVTDLVEYTGGSSDVDFDVVSAPKDTPSDAPLF